jgi:hypothetical protein
LSETTTQKTKSPGPEIPAELCGEPANNTPKSRSDIDVEGLLNSDSMLDQLELQVSLLTSAMTRNMVLATGAVPGLTEGPMPETQGYGFGKPPASERANGWAVARSLQLRDAAQLSFATASLVNAYAKLKGPSPQKFTTRHTIIPDPSGVKKPRKVTTITHHLVATQNARPADARAAQ